MTIDVSKPYWIMHRGRMVLARVVEPVYYVSTLDGGADWIVKESEMFETKDELIDSLKQQ